MKQTLVLLLCIITGVCLGSVRYQLQTELRTNYNGDISGKFLTGYTYDAFGNCILKRVFDGVDSTATLMSREVLSYDASGQIAQDLLLSATGDTLSIVQNTFSANGLVSVSTLNKDGSIRFIDSLFYSGEKLSELNRFNASGKKVFFHRYTYTGGLLSADSLYEPDGAGGFVPTQARHVSHNSDSTVAQEVQWRKSGTAWYAVGTTKMAYSQKLLISTIMYETDGASGSLTDSLSYIYDQFGNRTKESHFDNDRILTYDIIYTWKDMQPVGVIVSGNVMTSLQQVCYLDGRIVFSAPFTGIISVYSADGRKVSRSRIENSKCATLDCHTSNGRYFAMLNGTIKQNFSITINN
jgi:hypothetical protein